MSSRRWRWVAASVPGTAHLRASAPCQDACLVRVVDGPGGAHLVAAMADGAGTAAEGGAGAALACTLAVEAFADMVSGGAAVSALTRDRAEAWLADFQAAAQRRAEAAELTSRDYACTVMVALIGPSQGAFFQIGDGAMVVPRAGEPSGYEWVFWPAAGEFINETWFATAPDARTHLEWALVDGPIDAFAAFTDGLQRLVLHYESRTAHDPFFEQMFGFVEADTPEAALIEPLTTFLRSEAVNARTDDDKSLILASRRGGGQ